MRKNLILFIIASVLLLSIVECKKLRKQNPEKNKDFPLMVENGMDTSYYPPAPTYYTKSNDNCFKACENSSGNSVLTNGKYVCCSLYFKGDYYTNGWYSMYCYNLVLNCQGD
ncbi:hypothetical protein ABPG74_008738 [Tetrahymena malaccensis]